MCTKSTRSQVSINMLDWPGADLGVLVKPLTWPQNARNPIFEELNLRKISRERCPWIQAYREGLQRSISWTFFSRSPPDLPQAPLVMHPHWLDDDGQTVWLLLLGKRNPGCRCWSLQKLHFSKIMWRLALGFWMDLQWSATRRSVNLSVYLVFDLEARQF